MKLGVNDGQTQLRIEQTPLLSHESQYIFSGLISVRPPICSRKNYQYWLIYHNQTQQTFSNIINKCYMFR